MEGGCKTGLEECIGQPIVLLVQAGTRLGVSLQHALARGGRGQRGHAFGARLLRRSSSVDVDSILFAIPRTRSGCLYSLRVPAGAIGISVVCKRFQRRAPAPR